MLGWAKEPGETDRLRESESNQVTTLKNEKDQRHVVLSKLLSASSPGFIFPRDDLYEPRPAYNNPVHKSVQGTVLGEAKLANDGAGSLEDAEESKEEESSKDSTLGNCIAYCVIAIISAAFIAVLVCIVYFIVKNPKVVNLLLSVANETKKLHNDSERSHIPTILNPLNAKDVAKIINESRVWNFG